MSETVERETISAFSMRLAEDLKDAADDAGEPMDWFNIPNPSPEILAPIIERAVEKYVFGVPTQAEIAAAAKAMEETRLKLIAQPIARLYPQLAEAALKAAMAVRKGNEG